METRIETMQHMCEHFLKKMKNSRFRRQGRHGAAVGLLPLGRNGSGSNLGPDQKKPNFTSGNAPPPKIPKVPTPPAKVRSLPCAMGPPRWPSQQPDGPFHEPFAHHNKPTTNRTVRQHDVHTPRLGPSALCIVCHSFCLFLGDSENLKV